MMTDMIKKNTYSLETLSKETQEEIQGMIDNIVDNAVEKANNSTLNFIIKKIDIAIAQCHGGGNGRRLLETLREEFITNLLT